MSRVQVTTLSLVLGLLYFSPCISSAQRVFGVHWNVPENNQETIAQLDRFKALQIQYLEVDKIVSNQIWDEIQARNFKVFVQVPIEYPIVQTFSTPDSSILNTYRDFIDMYMTRDIAAFGAFAYGQTTRSPFFQAFEPFARELDSTFTAPLYIKDWNFKKEYIDTLVDFKVSRVKVTQDFESVPDSNFMESSAFFYAPSAPLQDLMTPLKWFIQKTSVNPEANLFFDGSWLLDFLQEHPSAKPIFTEFGTQQNALFPLPQERIPMDKGHSIIVLILLLLWGTFAFNYSFVPMYRKSLFRYFNNHAFFVEDVMKRHIRSIEPSLIILGQHIIMGGIFSYSLAVIFISESGLDVLHSYFPMLGFLGNGYFTFFIIGSLIMFIWEAICLFWLFLANRKLPYFSQVFILYSWSFQLNVIIISIIVTFFLAENHSFLLPVFLILFVLVAFLAFPITAFDTTEYLEKNIFWYSVSTIGLYLLLTGGILIVLFTNSYLMNILNLAVNIS